jgi:P4 family phage/plasmid primase-like protien
MNQIPVIYVRGAKPKLFGKFLSEVLYPGEIKTTVELMAYTFHRDNPFEVIVILQGDGSNGKSIVFGVLTGLHGHVSNVSLKTLMERPFGLFDLLGKNCNLDAELSSGKIEDTAILKKVTGRQLIRVEQKNQKAFDARIYAKMWLSANTIPNSSDQTDAWFRRNVIIAFPNKFDINEDLERGIRELDPNLICKLTTREELSGIFNVMMSALRRIIKNKAISIPQRTIEQRRVRYEMAVDPIRGFLDTAIDEDSDDDDTTTKEVMYAAYLEFCKMYELNGGTKDAFSKLMKKYHKEDKSVRHEKKVYRVWMGMKLTKQYMDTKLVKAAFTKMHEDGLQSSLGI